MDAKAKVVGRIGGVAGVDRMWDSQWVNVVNHDNCYRGWDENDAIAHAVRMTEQYMAENHNKRLVELLTQVDESASLAEEAVRQRDIHLTDHEAALAELREELQKQKSLNAGYQSTIAMIEVKLTTLLTGLEALAGVVDVIRLNSDYADAYMVNENIPAEARLRRARQVDQAIEKIENVRTLASAGLEGK